MKVILIMGLPGSGKTTLAAELAPMLNARRLNADEVRK
jgi:adenylylsulfate kinase